ncbi:MBL fold metallo-hydrolase [Melioribacter sp. Ez-97]|uniref:MBL fold metallo-hydrolase n=1 Tax=Melioribacter sp. Ez-97 TaxID=3423434 RepID=UPI003ED9C806
MSVNRRNFLNKLSLIAAGTFFSFLYGGRDSKAEERLELKYKPVPAGWDSKDITLSWIGHSTVLINFMGKWILTDPVLFERVGVYLFGTSYGPSRISPPALHRNEIPRPDIILLSHAHMDHMDYPTLKFFAQKYPGKIDVITSYLTGDVIEDLPWKSLNIMDWGDELNLGGINFRALEVKHFGWRFPWEKDRSRGFFKDGRSYNAYLIEYKNKKIVFGGDTAMTDKFDSLKNENVDIAIMPIGAYNPWRRSHCNPEEALLMAIRMNAKYFVPIHTKTFRQGSEPVDEPIEWLLKSASKYPIKVGLHEIGQTFSLNGINYG